MATKIWSAIPNEAVEQTSKHLGHWEQPDPKKEGEFNHHEILDVTHEGKRYLVFGGAANAIFLQSGYLEFEEDETLDHALQELHEELEVFYRDGRQFTNRIVCNERM